MDCDNRIGLSSLAGPTDGRPNRRRRTHSCVRRGSSNFTNNRNNRCRGNGTPISDLHWDGDGGNPAGNPEDSAGNPRCVCKTCNHVEARQRLRSSSSSSLIVSRTRLSTVGDRAFPVAAARVWNSMPDLVTSAPSVDVFRPRLKTHLFNISYPSPYDCTVPAQ